MIAKPKKYDEINVIEEYEKIELGPHKGIIIKVEEYVSEYSGKTSLKIYTDTSDDDIQPRYFKKQYENDSRTDKKYPNGAIKYVPLGEEENQVKMLKSFLTCIENSNNNYLYDWNKEVTQLVGKKICLVFGLEEYQDQEGKTRTATRLTQFRSLDKLNEIKIPKVKKLDGTFVDYDYYIAHRATASAEEIFGSTIVETDTSNMIEL